MGNYNPRAPQVLGEEWVPVRDEDFVFAPSVNTFEIGTTFETAAAQRVRTARFYVNTPQPTPQFQQTALVNVYPVGGEERLGPTQQVIIPVNAGAITGSFVSLGGASTVAEALATPGDGKHVDFAYEGGLLSEQAVGVFFAVNSFPQLNGKRILNVSLLYAGGVQDSDPITFDAVSYVSSDMGIPMSTVRIQNDAGTSITFGPPTFGQSNTGSLSELNSSVNNTSQDSMAGQDYKALNLGDINHWWDPVASPGNTTDLMPWNYADLQRFEAGAANRHKIYIRIQYPTPLNAPLTRIDYLALRVIYCEETRVMCGAKKLTYGLGANLINMRDLSRNTDPTLNPGTYLPTISWVNPGQLDYGQAANGDFPKLNALRQLGSIPGIITEKLNVPFPLEDQIGSTFTTEYTDIVPQLSLHTSGGVMIEPHVYGRTADAQLFGIVQAQQEILDANANGATLFPQVRFYARRFGNTTVPLLLESPNISGNGQQITLTPDEWDALPELIDGYKEITKRFVNPPSMGTGTNPTWRFSALGEQAGARWEVLGAIAPAISGVPGNTYGLVPPADRLGNATYGGTTAALSWLPGYAPPVTTATDDPSTDAVLIFSQDPATITGFTVTPSTQSLTGFAECGSGPCCIPTALNFNRITWNLPTNTAIALDDWNRTVTTGYGTAISGGAWAYSDAFAQYNIIGAERAAIKPAVANNQIYAFLANGGRDVEIVATIAVTGTTTGSVRGGLVSRYTDANNNYHALIQTDSTGATILNLIQTVGGSGTAVSNVSVPFTTYGGGRVKMKLLTQTWGTSGVMLKAKAWPITDAEPDIWHIEVNVNSGALTGTGVGISGRNSGAELLSSVLYDDFTAGPPRYWFNSYELQRKDDITDWQTIMRATDVTTTVFSDFEARAGMTSSYRIRQRNALLFDGQWSITGTGAVPEPGVTLPSCGTNRRGVLIFTTNADQTGASNLAYAMTWDNNVVENFGFPETDTLSVDRYLDRDYQVAFHGTERGGEQFSRRLLLANAAVALPRLANMRSLRDLAWEDVPYVCVRDDIGDRWFAAIVVTGGEVRRGRRLYNANIAVIETTGTAAEVNP